LAWHSQTREANGTTGNFMASPRKEFKKPLPQPNSDGKEAITAFFEKRPADFTWSQKAAVA
jgi:hypothetical protein